MLNSVFWSLFMTLESICVTKSVFALCGFNQKMEMLPPSPEPLLPPLTDELLLKAPVMTLSSDRCATQFAGNAFKLYVFFSQSWANQHQVELMAFILNRSVLPCALCSMLDGCNGFECNSSSARCDETWMQKPPELRWSTLKGNYHYLLTVIIF